MGKHLTDKDFNHQTKQVMLKALLAAGVISDMHDPKWHSMTAEEAAKMLADADIDHSKITDPAVREAIKMAHRVAAGDVHAARHVAAHAVFSKQAHIRHHEQAVSDAHAAVASKHLTDKDFNHQTKQVMLKALLAAGVISDMHDPKWHSMTAEEAA